MAKLLIDECLHASLLELARAAGHIADHVTCLGLGSCKDWDLINLPSLRTEKRRFEAGTLILAGPAQRQNQALHFTEQ